MTARPPGPSRPARSPRWAYAATLLACLLPACSAAEGPPVFPVEGKALFRGKPAVAAQVYLHPLDGKAAAGARPSGVVGEDGTFRLSSFRAFDGAPPGSYRLSVVWLSDAVQEGGENAGPDRLKGRYRDAARNPWTVVVAPGTNTIETLELR